MQSDFKVVKRRRQRKKVVELSAESQDFESLGYFYRKFKKAVEEFQSSRFCFELLQTIDRCLKCIGLTSCEILCYGLGNFLESNSSLHQLAALVEVHKKYNATVAVYDPVFTTSEIKILSELNFHIITNNEEGKRKITCDKVTLVFLPHCPKQLVNNFLWANWNISLCKCLLITNSFSKIIQDNTEKVLQKFADYILKIHQKTIEVPLENCYISDNIFNDISLHYFRCEDFDSNFFTNTCGVEPLYLEEVELITRNCNSLAIKNE